MSSKYKNLGKATQIALGFFAMFSAASSTSNILSSTMQADGYDSLGFYSLAMIALAMGVGSVVSTAVMNVIGYKACLMCGGFGTCVSIFALVLPALRAEMPLSTSWVFGKPFVYSILLLSEFCTGFGLALAWVA
jgi:hypothetical protein